MSNQSATEQFYIVLANIPIGRVITYGRLAQLAGKPGAARWAGRMLRNLPENSRLPWFRVINAQGKISFPLNSPEADLQYRLLNAEGIEINNKNRIDLNRFGY